MENLKTIPSPKLRRALLWARAGSSVASLWAMLGVFTAHLLILPPLSLDLWPVQRSVYSHCHCFLSYMEMLQHQLSRVWLFSLNLGDWLAYWSVLADGTPAGICWPAWDGASVFLWCLARVSKSLVLPDCPCATFGLESRLFLLVFCLCPLALLVLLPQHLVWHIWGQEESLGTHYHVVP